MINTINPPEHQPRNDMWPFPVGYDKTADQMAEAQQHNYINQISSTEASAVETGQPAAPVREGAVNQYESIPAADQIALYADREGRPIDPQAAEAALAAVNQIVNNAFDAAPEARAAQATEHHLRQVNQLAATFGPVVVKLREDVMKRQDYDLGGIR